MGGSTPEGGELRERRGGELLERPTHLLGNYLNADIRFSRATAVVRGQFAVPAFGHQKSPPLGVSFQFRQPRFSSPRAPLSSGTTRLR